MLLYACSGFLPGFGGRGGGEGGSLTRKWECIMPCLSQAALGA